MTEYGKLKYIGLTMGYCDGSKIKHKARCFKCRKTFYIPTLTGNYCCDECKHLIEQTKRSGE